MEVYNKREMDQLEKTFGRWVKYHLNKDEVENSSLQEDISDGKKFMKLIQVLSGESLGKPCSGQSTYHKMENINRGLQYLNKMGVITKIVSTEAILNGQLAIIIEIIWDLINHYYLQRIQLKDVLDRHGQNLTITRNPLLLWCQLSTAGYPGIEIRNFENSWSDGIALQGLIRRHFQQPRDQDKFKSSASSNPVASLNQALQFAETHLRVPMLIDAEDVIGTTNRKCLLTYLSTFYHIVRKNTHLPLLSEAEKDMQSEIPLKVDFSQPMSETDMPQLEPVEAQVEPVEAQVELVEPEVKKESVERKVNIPDLAAILITVKNNAKMNQTNKNLQIYGKEENYGMKINNNTAEQDVNYVNPRMIPEAKFISDFITIDKLSKRRQSAGTNVQSQNYHLIQESNTDLVQKTQKPDAEAASTIELNDNIITKMDILKILEKLNQLETRVSQIERESQPIKDRLDTALDSLEKIFVQTKEEKHRLQESVEALIVTSEVLKYRIAQLEHTNSSHYFYDK